MGKVKRNVKGLMNQKMRLGFFTVPLWLVGVVYLVRKLNERRRLRAAV
jgi:hypothetical protein